MNKNIILGLVVILVALGGIYLFNSKDRANEEGSSNNNTNVENVSETDIVAAIKAGVEAKGPVSRGGVEVVSVEEKEWSDACLGKADEGEMCAQVVTPGYEVVLEIGGESHTYRTNSDASVIKRD